MSVKTTKTTTEIIVAVDAGEIAQLLFEKYGTTTSICEFEVSMAEEFLGATIKTVYVVEGDECPF